MTQVKRDYKDTMFRMLFKDKKNLLSLYNAVNQTHHTDEEELQITTLENAVYMNMKNDISFMFHFQLYLYEHQSSVNPNMPVRDLFYVSKSLQDITKNVDLYSSTLKKIPTPRFIVFYNGIRQQPEKEVLCLSSAFEQETEHPELELKVTVLNINQGNNQEIMDACKTLRDYAAFVQMVRAYSNSLPLKEAIEKTIEECIQKDILADFLKKNRAEAMEVCLYEYNEELHLKEERDIAREKGVEIGKQQILVDLICRKLAKNHTVSEISDMLEVDQNLVQKINDIAPHLESDYDVNQILRMLESVQTEQGCL